MKVRMTTGSGLRAGVAAALIAVAAGCAGPVAGSQPRVLVVLAGRAAEDPALVQRAQALVADADGAQAQLRVPRTTTEQLAVTHLFAVRGYDEIIGVGLDGRVAVAPVRARYRSVRFTAAAPTAAGLARALARAGR
jgi:hypothetical protein